MLRLFYGGSREVTVRQQGTEKTQVKHLQIVSANTNEEKEGRKLSGIPGMRRKERSTGKGWVCRWWYLVESCRRWLGASHSAGYSWETAQRWRCH